MKSNSLPSNDEKMRNEAIFRTLRNRAILDWFNALDHYSRKMMVEIYAASLKCPLAEVNPEMTGEQDLDYLYKTYPKSLAEKSFPLPVREPNLRDIFNKYND